MFWLCLHKNIFIYISRLYLALFEAVSRRLSKAIKCIHKSQWFIKSWFGTLLLSIHFDIETLCCVVCVFSEKEYLQLPRGLGFNCEESVEFQVSNFRMMFSTRAQFHGSAYSKHRIGAYGSRELCAYDKRISRVSGEFGLLRVRTPRY